MGESGGEQDLDVVSMLNLLESGDELKFRDSKGKIWEGEINKIQTNDIAELGQPLDQTGGMIVQYSGRFFPNKYTKYQPQNGRDIDEILYWSGEDDDRE